MMPTAETLIDIGRRAGLAAVGVCRAEPFTDTETTLRERKAEGLHGGMQFTYRNTERSTDPSRILPDAAALVVGALDFYRGEPEHPDDGLPYARVAAYAREDHYSALRSALQQVAEALRAAGYRAVVVADDNALVDRAAAHRAGIGWWGKSSNILVPGAGSMVVLGAVVTNAPLCDEDPPPIADGCGSCRQCLDGCPHRRHRRSGCGGRPPLPGLAGPGGGGVPSRPPGGAGRSHLRLRRVRRCVPSQPGPGPSRTPATATVQRGLGVAGGPARLLG